MLRRMLLTPVVVLTVLFVAFSGKRAEFVLKAVAEDAVVSDVLS